MDFHLPQKVSSLLREKNIDEKQAAVFALLLLVALAYVAFTFSQQEKVSVLVSSPAGRLDGARVSVIDASSQQELFSGVTKNGAFSFTAPKGVLLLNVSKDGYRSPEGGLYAIVSVDPKKKIVPVFLQSLTAPIALKIFVADAFTKQPLPSATVLFAGAASTSAQTSIDGTASFTALLGEKVFLRVSKKGYLTDSRQIISSSAPVSVVLSPVVSPTKISFSDLPLLSGSSVVLPPLEEVSSFSDATVLLDAVPEGTLQQFSPTGLLLQETTVSGGVALLEQISAGDSLKIIDSRGNPASGGVKIISENQLVFSPTISSGVATIGEQQSIVVVLSEGKPVAGATVSFFDAAGKLAAISLTGSSGVATTTAIAASAVATVDGVASASLLQHGTASIVVPTASVNTTITLFDERGDAVTGTVEIFSKTFPSVPVATQVVSGSATIPLAAGEYYAVFSDDGKKTVVSQEFSAGSAVEAVLLPVSLGDSASVCVTSLQRECVDARVSKVFGVKVTVSSGGAPLQQASVSAFNSNGVRVASAITGADGAAFLTLSQNDYSLRVATRSSAVEQPLSVSADESLSIELPQPEAKAIIFVVDAAGNAVPATVRSTLGECVSPCSLPVLPGGDELVATATGFEGLRAPLAVSAGSTRAFSLRLVRSLAAGTLKADFLGFFDSLGNKVGSLVAGRDYSARFLLSAKPRGAGNAFVNARIGEGSVAAQPAGFLDFNGENVFAAKSSTYAPSSVCTDLQNAAIDGLYEWVEVGVEASENSPAQTTVSLPLRAKISSAASMLELFYRAYLKDAGATIRVPQQPIAAGLDECYAPSIQTTIPINAGAVASQCVLSGNTFADGDCLPQKPFACSNAKFEKNVAKCGCQEGEREENGACIPSTCSDGTAVGQCNLQLEKCLLQNNEPFLSQDSSCSCRAGFKLEGSSCTRCATSGCGLPATCSFSNLHVPVGCVLGNAPFFCKADGSIVGDAASCGCAANQQFSLASSSCVPRETASCNGVPADAGASSCDSLRPPKHCELVGGKAVFVDNALACGCGVGQREGFSCIAKESVSLDFPVAPPEPIVVEPVRECSQLSSCISAGSSDEYCTSGGKIIRLCSVCMGASCAGNFACSDSTGRCEELKCTLSGGSTPVNSCVENNAPFRCVPSSGAPVVREEVASCGCPPGKKPFGNTCVACATPDCADVAASECVDSLGNALFAGQCYPRSDFDASRGVFRCTALGKKPDAAACGCGDGYERKQGGGCQRLTVPNPAAATADFPQSCPGCAKSDSIFINFAAGKLESKSGVSEYVLVADAVFPADAMPLLLEHPSSGVERIVFEKVVSLKGREACYSYNTEKSAIVFASRGACPIVVRGNNFYDLVTGEKVSSDEATLVFSTSSAIASPRLEAKIRVSLASRSSLIVQPASLAGPDTPQLIFVANEKQSFAGGRQLSPGSGTVLLGGPGVRVLAWRGPGTLDFSEEGDSVAKLSYFKTSSYFPNTGEVGKRVTRCTDAFCCAGGWCSPAALEGALASFKFYAVKTASETAFRRGNGEPYATLKQIFSLGDFEVYSAAQVVEDAASVLPRAGFVVSQNFLSQQCNAKNPAVYSLRAATIDGRSLKLSTEIVGLHRYDYVGGQCADGFVADPKKARPEFAQQPLCDFLYGQGNCVKRLPTNSLASNTQASDRHSLPLQIDSAFIGLPPKFAGPVGLVGSYFARDATQNAGIAGVALHSVLQPLLYYQPVACKVLGLKYKAFQKRTDTACSVPNWGHVLVPPQPIGGFVGSPTFPAACFPIPCTTTLVFTPVITNTRSIITQFRACEDKDIKGIDGCRSVVASAVVAELEKVAVDISAAETKCISTCQLNAVPPASVCSPNVCTAIAVCTGRCRAEATRAISETTKKINACKFAAFAEISSGLVCEQTKGKLMDLPLVFPVPRTAWGTCFAYSDGCKPRCQPKKAYLQIIPNGNQLAYVAHYGLDQYCRPTAPSLFGTFANVGTNNLFERYALQSGQGAISGFLGSDYLTASSWFGAISAIASDKSCAVPTQKPPKTSRDVPSKTCYISPGEASTEPITKTIPGSPPATSGVDASVSQDYSPDPNVTPDPEYTLTEP